MKNPAYGILICRNFWNMCILRTIVKNFEDGKKNYKPAIRSIAPRRIPNIEVEAESIPKTIYPTINPIFRGM
jgi:hypothetical protein